MAVLLLVLLPGCATTSPHQVDIEDGSLHGLVRASAVTVLKDGQIAGAGAFVGQDRSILTAAHVVNPPGQRYEVIAADGEVIPVRVARRDLGHDLAVLVPTGVTPPRPTLAVAASMPPAGASIFVIAAPLFYADTLLPGRIARERSGFNHLGGLDTHVRSWIIAADTPKGASGGCWVNRNGQIIGVQSAFIGDDQGSSGIAFIAPADAIQQLLSADADADIAASTLDAELVDLQSQSPGFIGRFPKDSRGAAIHRIHDNGALADTGVPREALITHINGHPVLNLDQTLTQIRRYAPGTTVQLSVITPDDNEVREYDVELGQVQW
jgi:S1-C subfamily serine protease